MITRDMGLVLHSKEIQLITCSTGAQTQLSTVDALQSTTFAATGSAGRIVDRLGDMMTARYYAAGVYANIYSSRGSTEADRKVTLSVKLQHGDSSGGGDMADYSTQNQAADQIFWTTIQTTPMVSWSTAPFYGQTNQSYYDLKAAKRFVRTVVFASKNRVTTESSGDEGSRIGTVLALAGGDRQPQLAAWRGVGSTSTSTST